jgi:hypothetical protein
MINEWYEIPEETKLNAYTQVAESIGVTPNAVEKDWWVVQILSAIFEMDVGKHLIFKGGTSLSKAWNLIRRFSEDIDLAFDRGFFGFDKDLNRSQIKKLRKITGKYISEEFCPELENRLKDNGLKKISLKYIETEASDADPVQIQLQYPYVVNYSHNIQPSVLLEISCSSFYSLLDEHYFESSFAGEEIKVPTAIPERTFLEKIFLLHEGFQRPRDKLKVTRYSRHLYDLFQLIKSDFALAAVRNKELYETIVKHRQLFFHLGGVNYNLHQPQTINPIPPSELIDSYKEDYKTMQEEMIYGESPAFEEMIDTIKAFIDKELNQSTWKMDAVF